MPFVMDKFKSKMELQYQKNSHYITEVQYDKSDLPYKFLFKIRIINIKYVI